MGTMPKIIIVIPCYNEERRLDTAKIIKFAADNRNICFLMVNDGSTDKTVQLLAKMAEGNDRQISCLDLPRNMGKADAVRQGVVAAFRQGADFVGYWDADLATPLYEINNLVQYLVADSSKLMAFGSRIRLLNRRIARKSSRHYLGRIFATIASLVLRVSIYDTQCGAKLFRNTRKMRGVFSEKFISRWIFDVEIFARCVVGLKGSSLRLSDTAVEHPLMEWCDVPGSKLKIIDFLQSFLELASIISFIYAPWSERKRAIYSEKI